MARPPKVPHNRQGVQDQIFLPESAYQRPLCPHLAPATIYQRLAEPWAMHSTKTYQNLPNKVQIMDTM